MNPFVHVWVPPDLSTQHHAPAPDDDTTHEWDGTTACGLAGALRWVPGEVVDRGVACERCMALAGTNPPLEGEDPGPV